MSNNKRQSRSSTGENQTESELDHDQVPPQAMDDDSDADNGNMRMGQSQMDLVLQRATRAIEQRINRLQVPREAMQIGESVVGALLTAQDPLRRTMKKEPGLTIAGVAALCAGGVLLGIAIARTGGTSRPKSAKESN